MKLGPVYKIDKRNKTTSKRLMMTSCRKIVTSLSFIGFLANLEQSGGQIPDTESAKSIFSFIVTFCLTKIKTKLKNLYYSSHTIALSKCNFLSKNANFLQKNADISKIKRT